MCGDISSNFLSSWAVALASLGIYLKECVFCFIQDFLTFLVEGFWGYLFHYLDGNGAINSFFMLQPEITFQHINMIYQSCLKHWCGFPMILGWKQKSITYKVIPTSPFSCCTISLLILLTLRFYSLYGSLGF